MNSLDCSAAITANITSVFEFCRPAADTTQALYKKLVEFGATQSVAHDIAARFAFGQEQLADESPLTSEGSRLAVGLEAFADWGLAAQARAFPLNISVERLTEDAIDNDFESLHDALHQWKNDDDFFKQLCDATAASTFVESLDEWALDENYPTTRFYDAHPEAELDDDALYEVHRKYESELYAAKANACGIFAQRLADEMRAQLPIDASDIDADSIAEHIIGELESRLPECYCCEV